MNFTKIRLIIMQMVSGGRKVARRCLAPNNARHEPAQLNLVKEGVRR
jgi:hypothetical protein